MTIELQSSTNSARVEGHVDSGLSSFFLGVRRILPWIALATIPFCILSLAIALSDLRAYPGLDLHLKVVGARRLAAGFNPYDPNSDPLHRDYFKSEKNLTSSPALLVLYIPLRDVPYLIQRDIYFWLDWVLAAGSFLLIAFNFCKSRDQRLLCGIVFALFLLCGFPFRMHLACGQYYVLQLFLGSLAAVSIQRKSSGWLSVLAPALLLLLRPTYALMLFVPLICLGARRWTLRVVIATAALFVATLAIGPAADWSAYFRMIHTRQAQNIQMQHAEICKLHLAPNPINDEVIDGIDFEKRLHSNAVDGTFISFISFVLLHTESRFRHACDLFSIPWITRINFFGMLFTLAGGAALVWTARRRQVSSGALIALAFAWPLLFEVFGPERYSYTAVVEVLPFALLLLDPVIIQRAIRSYKAQGLWAGILILGVLPPIVMEFLPSYGVDVVASVLTLLVLPAMLAAVCAWAVLTSPASLLISRAQK